MMEEADLVLLRHELDLKMEAWRAEETRRLETWRQSEARIMEAWRLEHATRTNRQADDFRAANVYGVEAAKASLLINAGAAAALLAFIGSNSPVAQRAIRSAANGELWLVCGVAFAALSLGFGMQAMDSFAQQTQPDTARATMWRTLAFVCGFGSVGLFIAGCLTAAVGIIG
jgi:hypothetical protein